MSELFLEMKYHEKIVHIYALMMQKHDSAKADKTEAIIKIEDNAK